MKKIKILSLFCALTIALSTVAGTAFAGSLDGAGLWHPASDNWAPIEKGDDVIARFAIGGDSHIMNYYSIGKLENAYRALEKIGGVDAFIIAGDVTDGGRQDQYTELMRIVNKYSKTATVDLDGKEITATGSAVGTTILSMGNHDDWTTESGAGSQEMFRSNTGQEPNAVYRINGVPILKMSPGEAPHDSGEYSVYESLILDEFSRIDAENEQLGYTGPIIGIAHHPFDTPYKDSSDFYSDAEIEAFRAHADNFILFAGHSHTLLYDTARVINQSAGFTQIRTGTLGNNYGATNGGSARNPETGTTGSPYTDATLNSSQCLLVDVLTNGTTRVRRLDLNLGRVIFESDDFIIDPENQIGITVSEGKTANYFSTGKDAGTYGANSAAPSFPAGAKVTVEDVGNHDSITVTFPRAESASDSASDYLWRYQVVLTPEGGESDTRNYMNDAHLEVQRDVWHVTVVGLEKGVDYTVKVRAQTPYGAYSEWLEAEGTVNVGVLETKYPAEPIFEVNADTGSYAETHGRTVNEVPSKTSLIEDASTGKTSVRLFGIGGIGYSFGQDDFNRIKYATTLEAYFKLSDNQSAQSILGSIDSANIALRVDGGRLFLWGTFASNADRVSSDKIIVSTPVPENEWIHAIAVCDGSSVKLYVNGELKGSGTGSGGIRDPYFPDDPYGGSFWIGSMSYAGNDNKSVILPVSSRTEINLARVYEGAMTADDVAEAYRTATAKKASLIFRDVTKGAFYEEPVTWAVANGITAGTSKVTFSPNNGCTRGQVVTFLWRAAGSPDPGTENNPFNDVKADDYFFKAVLWAVGHGVTLGTSDHTFSPNKTCTRGEIVTFLFRASGGTETPSAANIFTDVKGVDYFFIPVLWATENGITFGTGKTTFSPNQTCTRAQVVTFLFRSKQ